MMAREAIGKLINSELFIKRRLKEIHGDVELKQEGGKDGVSIEELSNVKEATCVCVRQGEIEKCM